MASPAALAARVAELAAMGFSELDARAIALAEAAAEKRA